jgi:hypothetical protein
MEGRVLPGKKQDFGLTQSTRFYVECLLRATSGQSIRLALLRRMLTEFPP